MSVVGTILLHSSKGLLCDKFKRNVSARTCFCEYVVLVSVSMRTY